MTHWDPKAQLSDINPTHHRFGYWFGAEQATFHYPNRMLWYCTDVETLLFILFYFTQLHSKYVIYQWKYVDNYLSITEINGLVGNIHGQVVQLKKFSLFPYVY